jgi:DNA helicase IV
VVLVKTQSDDFDQVLISTVEDEMGKVDFGTVGVIVPHDRVDRVKSILNNAGIEVGISLASPVSVLAVDEAKGLEFDSVVISGANQLVGNFSENLQALYVAMTRTTKRLIILDNQDTPEFVVRLVSSHN